MHGTDLGDLYRGDMSLRQVWVRVKAVLATDLEQSTPLRRALDEAEKKAEAAQRDADLDDVLNRYRKG